MRFTSQWEVFIFDIVLKFHRIQNTFYSKLKLTMICKVWQKQCGVWRKKCGKIKGKCINMQWSVFLHSVSYNTTSVCDIIGIVYYSGILPQLFPQVFLLIYAPRMFCRCFLAKVSLHALLRLLEPFAIISGFYSFFFFVKNCLQTIIYQWISDKYLSQTFLVFVYQWHWYSPMSDIIWLYCEKYSYIP